MYTNVYVCRFECGFRLEYDYAISISSIPFALRHIGNKYHLIVLIIPVIVELWTLFDLVVSFLYFGQLRLSFYSQSSERSSLRETSPRLIPLILLYLCLLTLSLMPMYIIRNAYLSYPYCLLTLSLLSTYIIFKCLLTVSLMSTHS